MLLMKKKYFDAIRAGTKTTTLRYWQCCRIKAGSVHAVPGLGRVFVESVQVVNDTDLTDADAQADGFQSLRQLRRALAEIYSPLQRRQRKLYKVAFTFGQGEQPAGLRESESATMPTGVTACRSRRSARR